MQIEDHDANLVKMWTTVDPARWLAGICAGLFAGAVMLAFAVVLATALGSDSLLPLKFGALPFVGGAALESGTTGSVILGLIAMEILCAFFGFVYAHFTQTNSFSALLPMGVVWGLFSWVFLVNLFLPAFKPILAAQVSPGAMFPVVLVYGIALSSVSFFHRVLAGGKAART